MLFFRIMDYFKWLSALILSVVLFFPIALLNLTAFPFEGDKEYYLYTPSSNAQIKNDVNLSDLPFIRGERVILSNLSSEDLASILARYSANVIKEEEFLGGVSYYCYSPKLEGGIMIDGEVVNLQIAIKKDSVVLGTPIIFGGY